MMRRFSKPRADARSVDRLGALARKIPRFPRLFARLPDFSIDEAIEREMKKIKYEAILTIYNRIVKEILHWRRPCSLPGTQQTVRHSMDPLHMMLFLHSALGVVIIAALAYIAGGRRPEFRFSLVVSLLLLAALFAFLPLIPAFHHDKMGAYGKRIPL
jgi:hypothetical protein